MSASCGSWARPRRWCGGCSQHFVQTPGDLPPEWLAGLEPGDAVGRALRIADYIAGMTDRYAIGEHARLFGWTPELK